jgi:hypothetical protein
VRVPTFVRDVAELESARHRDCPCPHCGRWGTLVGHGFVHGYDPAETERVLRGRRLLCSNRHRRAGCGRTVAVLLATALRRRVATTASLSALWRALANGRASSSVAEAGLTRRSRCRLLEGLERVQHRVRSWVLGVVPPPSTASPRPLVQLWHHLLAAVGDTPDPIAQLQLRTGRHLLV